jgi:DNA-binding response OmpR family regulator
MGAGMQSRGHTVVVVEDDEGIRALMVDFLRDEGILVEEARDGAEAIEILDRYGAQPRHLCVILLDLMLPRVSGIDVIRRIREAGQELPVVALSASRNHLAEAMLAGASMAVAKPFDIEEILSVVTSHCPYEHG